jgi:integrase
VTLKGVKKKKAKGRTYYYAWLNGPRLVGEPGSPEFFQSYNEAHEKLRNPQLAMDEKRFSTWVARYKASDAFQNNAEVTKQAWLPFIDKISDHFGALSVKQFDRAEFRVDIRKWLDKTWKGKDRTRDYAKQVLSALLTFIVSEGKLTLNICHEIPNVYSNDRSDKVWEEHHWQMLMQCPHVSDEIKWAARFFRRTGYRLSDGITAAWAHVEPYAIEKKTSKSSGKKAKKTKTATAPMTAALRELLKEIPKRSTLILTSSKGRPWTADGFGSSWWTAMERSGLHAEGIDLHLHDLRGTFATDLYRAEFSIREIAETLGWAEERVERLIDRYVKRDEIMKSRIRRLEAVTAGS